MTQSRDLKVGYKSPPQHSRFKAGQSGNPRGRPKKSTVGFELVQELKRTVTIRENGVEQKTTKAAALAKSLVARALSGDMRAIGHLIRLLPVHFQPPEEVADQETSPSDMQALQRFIERKLAGAELAKSADKKLDITPSDKDTLHD
jgi:hypothetical protein